MNSLKNLSIKNKLVGIILVTVLLAVGIGFTAVTTINIKELRKELVNSAVMNTTLINEHCVVPLTFQDNNALAKALQQLNSVPYMENGCVYDTSGNLLAVFNRNEEIIHSPVFTNESRWYFENDFLHVLQPIIYNNRELGNIHIAASTEFLSQKIKIYFLTMLAIGFGLILFSYFIALKLQAVISKPILNLAAVTREISRLGDYTVRVQYQRTDEIGELYSGFNNMLDQINRRESERNIAEKAMKQSNKRFKELAELLPEAVFETDLNLNITFANKQASGLFGYTNDELNDNLNCIKLFAPSDRKNAELNIKRRLLGEETNTLELLAIDKNQSTFPILFQATAIMKEENIIGLRAIFVDITETKRLQELESRAERLETAGTIAGQVAHDFNNLLAPLMAYPEFIREELPEGHPSLKYVNQIEKAAHKIAEINQDLLTMGRRGHYNQKALNLNTIVQHTLEELKPYIKSSSLTYEMNLSDELMDILGGNAQLHRMISNLLHNAIDVTNENGCITIKTENYYIDDDAVIYGKVPRGEYVKLTITDTGSGIPDDIVQKIFDPFFTTKSADKKRGSGLGMSVVDAVIKDHNGYIDLDTKVDHGTSFFLYFPITREAIETQDIDKTYGGNETILVVDDDDVQREVSTLLLKKLGYKVQSANSGENALQILSTFSCELVLLDMVMPGGIDGAETYRQILELNPIQKAIILSGFSESDRVKKALELGAGAFVKKPVTKNIISAAVRAELDRKIDTTHSL